MHDNRLKYGSGPLSGLGTIAHFAISVARRSPLRVDGGCRHVWRIAVGFLDSAADSSAVPRFGGGGTVYDAGPIGVSQPMAPSNRAKVP